MSLRDNPDIDALSVTVTADGGRTLTIAQAAQTAIETAVSGDVRPAVEFAWSDPSSGDRAFLTAIEALIELGVASFPPGTHDSLVAGFRARLDGPDGRVTIYALDGGGGGDAIAFVTSGGPVTVNGGTVHTAGTVVEQLAAASAGIAATVAGAAIPGLTLNATVAGGDVVLVRAVVDFDHTVAGAGLALGELRVDGAAEAAQVIVSEAAGRATGAQQWRLTGLSPGPHTLAMFAKKSAAGGTVNAKAIHSTLTAEVRPA